jgi:hypothetical protein
VSFGNLGTSLLEIADVTGDGVPDLVAGAPHVYQSGSYNQSGSILLIDGATGGTLQVFQPFASTIPLGVERFGTSLALLPPTQANEAFGRLIVGCGSATTSGQRATVAVRLGIGAGGIITQSIYGGTLFAFQADGAMVGPDHAGIVEIVRLNQDASDDVVIGVSRGAYPTTVGGSVQLYRMRGAAPFGSGPAATHTLTIQGSPSTHLFSFILVTGGTPGNGCLLGGSMARPAAPLPFAGGEVLIDVFDPSFVLLPSVSPFNALGSAIFGFEIAHLLNGTTWFAQALELNAAAPQGVFFSNGLEFTF